MQAADATDFSYESSQLASVIDDEILQTFAVVAEPADVPAEIDRRYGHLADRISVYADTPG